MPKVRLRMTQENKVQEFEAPKKANLLKFLQEKEIPIGNACGGHGLCASCKVIVVTNEQNLSTPNDVEIGLSLRNQLMPNERISCQCKVLGDIEITTSYW